MAIQLATLFPSDLQRHINNSPTLVLPFGTIEWHSHHLPLGLDGLVAQHISERMAVAMNGVLAPISYWAADGVSFPYTLALPLAEVEPLLPTLFKQYVEMGFQNVVAFTGHFGLGQTLAIKRAAFVEMQRSRATILPLTTYDLVADFYAGDHAGIGETSLLMAIRSDLVRLNSWPSDEALPGVIGEDPRIKANRELGLRIINVSVSRAAALVAALGAAELDRDAWIATLKIVVEILELTRNLRQELPRDRVPPITTPEYLRGWKAIAEGRFTEAQEDFREKLRILKESATS